MTYTAVVQGRTCAFGIDVSNNNGKRAIDAQQVAGRGFVFVCAKATEGATYRDAFYAQNRDRTKAAGMLFGGYHWLKPGAALSSQVASFLNHTSNGAGCDFIACDAEESGLTDELVVGWCEQVRAATGVPVWIYCGSFTDPQRRSDRWLKFTPWLAAYPTDADNDDDPTDIATARAPGPWGRWDVWQYDSDGAVPGVAGNCDLNVIDVRVLAQLTTDQEDDVTPEDIENIAKRVTAYLANPATNPGTIAADNVEDTLAQIQTALLDPKTGMRALVANMTADVDLSVADVEQAVRQALEADYDVELTLTPKG